MSTIDLPTIRQRFTVDGGALDGLKGKMGGVAGTIGKGIAVGAGVAGAAVVALGVKGAKSAIQVETGVREVVTLFGETGDAAAELTAELTAGVSDLSSEVGIAQNEITGGLYSAISAGVPKDNAFDFMRVASEASIAGVTDVETAVDGLTTTINAFGLDSDQAQEVADSMFAAVQGGKTTFEELSASMFNVAPAAAGLGIDFQDVNAALATLTASGTPTSVATTQMRAALAELGKESSVAGTNFQEITGTTFPEFIASGGTLQEALAEMATSAGGNATELQNMFGSVEAGAAAAQLGVTNMDKFSDELERQEGSAGAAGDAYETMNETTGRALERLKVQFDNIVTAIGAKLLPVIADVATWIGDRLPGWIDKATPYVEALVDTFKAVASWIGERAPAAFAAVKAAVEPVLAAFRTVAETVIPVIRKIVARFQAGGDTMSGTGSRLGEVFQKVGGVVRRIGETISLVVSWIAGVWERYGEEIMASVRTTFDAIMSVISGALDIIMGIFDVVLGILTGDWSRAWDGIKSILAGAWSIITGVVEQAINGVKTMIGLALAIVQTVFADTWQSIVDALSGAWDAIVGFVAGGVESVKEKGREALDWFRELPGRILDALGNLGTMLLDAGRQIIQGLIDGIAAKIQAVRDVISTVTGAIGRFFPGSPVKEGPLTAFNRGQVGEQLADMLADGMASGASKVSSSARGLASAAVAGLPDHLALPTTSSGLALAAASGPGRAGRATATTAPTGGAAFRDLVVHNPDREPTEESVNRQMRRLAHLGVI